MDGEIGKALIAAMADFGGYEIRFQHAIATLARRVVHAINGQMQFTREQSHPAAAHGDACCDNSTVLVVITGKQVSVELRINALRQDQSPRRLHGREFNHFNTFWSLRSAVSVAALCRLARRESWIADWFRNEPIEVASPNGLPSQRKRSCRTKWGYTSA